MISSAQFTFQYASIKPAATAGNRGAATAFTFQYASIKPEAAKEGTLAHENLHFNMLLLNRILRQA